MKPSYTPLLLLPAALLCSSCKDNSFSSGSIAGQLHAATRTAGHQQNLLQNLRHQLISPAIYVFPRDLVDISSSYYVKYSSCDLGEENWYNPNLPYYKNIQTLETIQTQDPERAARILRAYEQRAQQGDTAAMMNAGSFHYEGIGTAANPHKALKYFRMAAAQGGDDHSIAFYNLMHVMLQDSAFSPAHCLHELVTEAERHPEALNFGELFYLLGKEKVRNEREEIMLGNALAYVLPKDATGSCDYVAALYHLGGTMGMPQDDELALKLLHQSAEAENGGYAYAQLVLGYIYQFGMLGQEQDMEKAQHYLRLAADEAQESECAEVCQRARVTLALLARQQGAGTEVREALQQAAAAGDPYALYNLGILQLKTGENPLNALGALLRSGEGEDTVMPSLARLYCALHGEGGQADINPEEFQWMLDKNDPALLTLLANCYATGTGVQQDPVAALRLYMQLGDMIPTARHNLALCYALGIGVRRDAQKAAELMAEAEKRLRQQP